MSAVLFGRLGLSGCVVGAQTLLPTVVGRSQRVFGYTATERVLSGLLVWVEQVYNGG